MSTSPGTGVSIAAGTRDVSPLFERGPNFSTGKSGGRKHCFRPSSSKGNSQLSGGGAAAFTTPPGTRAHALSHAKKSPQASALGLPGTLLLKQFDHLYEKYQRRVYRQCFRMLRNTEDAEDLTQEVFLQLYRKVHTFRGEANFSTWLHRLTVNTVLMRLRRHRRWNGTMTSLDSAPGGEDSVTDLLNTLRSVPSPATNRLDKIGLDVAIAKLSSGYKDIFLLHDVEGFRHDEIAKLLGISEGTSKSQLHKARLRLRALMGQAIDRKGSGRRARPASGDRKTRSLYFRAA